MFPDGRLNIHYQIGNVFVFNKIMYLFEFSQAQNRYIWILFVGKSAFHLFIS